MTSYRAVFMFVAGVGPWPCYGCGLLVEPNELHVHHLDENHVNDDPANLVAMHQPCHNRLHQLGKSLGPLSEERRRQIGDQHRGKVMSAETRKKISDTMLGHEISPETRAKISAAMRGRLRT